MFNITHLNLPLFLCLPDLAFIDFRTIKGKRANQSSVAEYWVENGRSKLAAMDTGVRSQINILSEQEKAKGWELLFDGWEPSSQWRSVRGNDFSPKGWVREQRGLVQLLGNRGGDIIPGQLFVNFERVLDCKLTDLANKRIKHVVSELRDLIGKTVLNGLEFQLKGDFKHKTVYWGGGPESRTGS